jgi:hypothetical protein
MKISSGGTGILPVQHRLERPVAQIGLFKFPKSFLHLKKVN